MTMSFQSIEGGVYFGISPDYVTILRMGWLHQDSIVIGTIYRANCRNKTSALYPSSATFK